MAECLHCRLKPIINKYAAGHDEEVVCGAIVECLADFIVDMPDTADRHRLFAKAVVTLSAHLLIHGEAEPLVGTA